MRPNRLALDDRMPLLHLEERQLEEVIGGRCHQDIQSEGYDGLQKEKWTCDGCKMSDQEVIRNVKREQMIDIEPI